LILKTGGGIESDAIKGAPIAIEQRKKHTHTHTCKVKSVRLFLPFSSKRLATTVNDLRVKEEKS
jgi:hypothetical protein